MQVNKLQIDFVIVKKLIEILLQWWKLSCTHPFGEYFRFVSGFVETKWIDSFSLRIFLYCRDHLTFMGTLRASMRISITPIKPFIFGVFVHPFLVDLDSASRSWWGSVSYWSSHHCSAFKIDNGSRFCCYSHCPIISPCPYGKYIALCLSCFDIETTYTSAIQCVPSIFTF